MLGCCRAARHLVVLARPSAEVTSNRVRMCVSYVESRLSGRSSALGGRGSRIVTCKGKGDLAAMSVRGTRVQEFLAHEGDVTCLYIGRKSAGVLVTGGDDKKVSRWGRSHDAKASHATCCLSYQGRRHPSHVAASPVPPGRPITERRPTGPLNHTLPRRPLPPRSTCGLSASHSHCCPFRDTRAAWNA